MEPSQIVREAVMQLGHVPTDKQAAAIGILSTFACRRSPREAIIINGYAGTGKTSAMAAVIGSMHRGGMKPVVLAPTGRAAKVAATYGAAGAQTIHKHIYRPDPLDDGRFVMVPNRRKDTVFFIDEASMISCKGGRNVLSDLIRFVYSSPGCAMVLIGDLAQLPPVGEQESGAMNPEVLRRFGLEPTLIELTEPVRHAEESGMLFNSTVVRQIIRKGSPFKMPTLRVNGFDDVTAISSAELAEELSSSWSRVGSEETLLITRSNWRANRYNDEIRRRVMMAEDILQRGERLIVAKNNYYWLPKNDGKPTDDFIANGETVIVNWAGKLEKMYGRYFQEVELSVPGREQPIGAKIMVRSLRAEGPAIPKEEMDRLFNYALNQQEGELSQKLKALDDDPFYNALQVKYAYCVTCHKAQGGQWKHVYIDMSGIAEENMQEDFYRWLYTAMTRATEKLVFVNPTLPLK